MDGLLGMLFLTLHNLSTLLKEGLKLEKKPRMVVYHDLDHLAGTWSDEDYSEFQKKVADFEKLDKDLW